MSDKELSAAEIEVLAHKLLALAEMCRTVEGKRSAHLFKTSACALLQQQATIARLTELVKEGRRAVGTHFAPDDCYATGPKTGDPIVDLVQCPACCFLAMYEDAIARKALTP